MCKLNLSFSNFILPLCALDFLFSFVSNAAEFRQINYYSEREFELHSGEVYSIQHYMIKFVSD
jgi:hypothetical protein